MVDLSGVNSQLSKLGRGGGAEKGPGSKVISFRQMHRLRNCLVAEAH